MVQGLTGLSAIAGYQVLIDEQSQATPEERYGGPADPKHGQWGEQAKPYPWQSNSTQAAGFHGPFGPQNQMLGDESWIWESGGDVDTDPTYDYTPNTHAAPYPRGLLSGPIPGETPDAVAAQRLQSMQIHATNKGGSRKLIETELGWAQQDEWTEINNLTPGNSEQSELPGQMKSSGYLWGTTDRVQSFAHQNSYGFDSAHMHRRFAAGSIPGNNYWMRPGGRPLMKTLAGPARPAIGPNSPFHGDDLGQAFSPAGAVLLNQPTEYVAPPQPYLAPATVPAYDAEVAWY